MDTTEQRIILKNLRVEMNYLETLLKDNIKKLEEISKVAKNSIRLLNNRLKFLDEVYKKLEGIK